MSAWSRMPGVGRWGFALTATLCLLALFAGSLSPFDPEGQLDPVVASRRPPLTVLWQFQRPDGRLFLAESYRVSDERFEITRRGEAELSEPGELSAPSRRLYLFGTDRLGRDVYSRVLYGARTSLAVGCLSVALALTLGVMAGGVAALAGPLVDTAIMRLVDGLLAFPQLLLILTLALLFEPSTTTLILIIGSTGWMGLSRLVRAELRRLKSHSFILASRGLGAGPLRVFVRHLLPNAWPPILAAASLMVGDAILVETALSFLGLGVAADLPSWGRMISDAKGDLVHNWWMSALPGSAVAITVLAFHLISDGLRDAFDPRTRSASDKRYLAVGSTG